MPRAGDPVADDPAKTAAVERRALPDAAPTRAASTTGEDLDGPRVVGRVEDATGAPLAGAKVVATNDRFVSLDDTERGLPFGRRAEAETDASGRYELRVASAGFLKLGARAAGFAPYTDDDLTLPADDVVELDPIVLEPGAILSGHVLDADRRPVAGAELVRLDPRDEDGVYFFGSGPAPVAVTAADGTFRVDQLALGEWKLLVRSDDHPDGHFEGVAEQPGIEVSGLEFVLERGATIAGRAIDVPDSEKGKLMVRAREVSGDWMAGFRARTAEVKRSGESCCAA